MITKENLKFAFDDLTEDEVNNVMNSNSDYLTFEMHHFNVGSYASIESVEYSEELEEEITGTGNLIIDKDQFLQLFEESESVNPFILEHV